MEHEPQGLNDLQFRRVGKDEDSRWSDERSRREPALSREQHLVLSLQRRAGNRAVADLLHGAGPVGSTAIGLPPIQRKTPTGVTEPMKGVPASLAGLEMERVSGGTPKGLPDRLKSGIEDLSGISMDGVKVHYNSSKPAQLQAHAYAQGNDIFVAPGQEQHLAHEAWHVVQQAQGRVQPSMQMKAVAPVNDNDGLEREADTMGRRAEEQGMPASSESNL
ncbi:MAG TPA: DUF4157 domain-containing protein [Acidimicrobiales bacterium]